MSVDLLDATMEELNQLRRAVLVAELLYATNYTAEKIDDAKKDDRRLAGNVLRGLGFEFTGTPSSEVWILVGKLLAQRTDVAAKVLEHSKKPVPGAGEKAIIQALKVGNL